MRVVCLWFPTPAPVAKVAENCLRFSPQICLRPDQALFIEIGKCRQLYSEESFLARLQVVLRRMNLHAQIALGTDIPDSLVMAKYQTANPENLPLHALLDLADPFNRDPVLQKYVTKLITSFQDLGVRNLREFKKIPTAELTTRFGPVGILCKQRTLGEMSIPWPHWVPAEVVSERTEFSYFEFYGELEPILFELKKQLDQIFTRLWSRALKAQKIEVRIFCERNSQNPDPFIPFEFDFLLPQSTTKGALNIIRERLSRDFQRRPVKSPIEALETTVRETVPHALGQKNFLHRRDETAEQLHALLGQLSEAHGRDNIFQAELTEERRPEKSWRKNFKISHDTAKTRVELKGRIPLRPTYLMKPERIEVTGQMLHIRKKPFQIIKWSEMTERITGGWLESNTEHFSLAYDRNYYQVELETGVRLSIYQTPDQDFYLHGYFG